MPGWKLDKARAMRKQPTETEALVWEWLKRRRLRGLKFRRQAPLYGYIADFYCPERRLVVEIDGPSHDDRQSSDKERDTRLARKGVRTIRVTIAEVLDGSAKARLASEA